MKCEEVRAALLAGTENDAINAHLAGCRACRAEQPVMSRLRTVLSSPSLWEEPAPDMADRIVSTLRSQREEPDPPRFRKGSLRSRTDSLRSRTGAAVAAAVVVVAAAGFGLTRLGPGAPDWTLDLAVIDPQPGAMAVIDGWATDTGTRMVLEIAGIEEAPSGHYYEIWLTAPDGRHVSAGTFSGPGTITAFAGVRRADFPRVWITLEAEDGDQGPSSETYFDTPIPDA